MNDNAVIFLKDWKVLILSMPAEQQLEFWELFTSYEYGTNQECSNPNLVPIWTFIKTQLDNMKDKYNAKIVNRNRVNGAKGGRPKKETHENPKNPMGYLETQKTHKDKDNEKDKEKDNVFLLEKETKERAENSTENSTPVNSPAELSKKVAQKKVFKPPPPEEVQAYCDERMNGITGQEFCNFYESKNWMIGKNKMTNWQAAVRTWESKRQKENNNGNRKISGRSTIATDRIHPEFT